MKTVGITSLLDFYNISNGLIFNTLLWYKIFKEVNYNPVFIVPQNYDIEKYSKEYEIIHTDNKNELQKIDIIFEIAFSDSYLYQLKEICGYKIIKIELGHVYQMDVESYILNKNLVPVSKNVYDEVWCSPHFKHFKQYLIKRYNCEKIFVCPYIWEPFLIEQEEITNVKFSSNNPINIGILEPNINFCKTNIIPITICEQNSNYISNVKSYSSTHIINNKNIINFVTSLNIHKEGKITFEHRYPFVKIINVDKVNCIISYTERCTLNYLYLECLYTGIPLLHNSDELKDFGFYYDIENLEKCSQYFTEILNNFDREKYIENNKKIFNAFSIYNKYNQSWIISRLDGSNSQDWEIIFI